MFLTRKAQLVAPEQTLPGRSERRFELADKHVVLGTPVVTDEVPDGYEVALFGLGCFWGAEEIYWQVPGVWSTSVGYAGGTTPNPSYEEVCSGATNHTEAVRIVFDDGHSTGIYSWSWLYRLGAEQATIWAAYLAEIERQGLSRDG